MRAQLFTFLLLLSLHGCAQSLAVTGTTLEGVGDQFVAVAAVYKTGCDSGKLTPTQCAAFKTFGTQFQRSYPLAVQTWKAARGANDAASAKQAEGVVTALASSLSQLATDAFTAYGLK